MDENLNQVYSLEFLDLGSLYSSGKDPNLAQWQQIRVYDYPCRQPFLLAPISDTILLVINIDYFAWEADKFDAQAWSIDLTESSV